MCQEQSQPRNPEIHLLDAKSRNPILGQKSTNRENCEKTKIQPEMRFRESGPASSNTIGTGGNPGLQSGIQPAKSWPNQEPIGKSGIWPAGEGNLFYF